MFDLFWCRIGAWLAAAAVLLGAYGAHALGGRFDDHTAGIWRTATFYHLVHALSIYVVAWLGSHLSDPKIRVAGWLFVAGIIFFSGSLYLLVITGARWFGAVTPVGGLCFVSAWVLIATSGGRR